MTTVVRLGRSVFCWLAAALVAVTGASAGSRALALKAPPPAPPLALKPQPQGPPPLGAVDIADVSNGCGGGSFRITVWVQNQIGDSSVYRDSAPFLRRYPVDFREACKLHDAGYSGAKVWDAING